MGSTSTTIRLTDIVIYDSSRLGSSEDEGKNIYLQVCSAGREIQRIGPVTLRSESLRVDDAVELSLDRPSYDIKLLVESPAQVLGSLPLVTQDLVKSLSSEHARVDLMLMRSEDEESLFKISFTCVRGPQAAFALPKDTASQLDTLLVSPDETYDAAMDLPDERQIKTFMLKLAGGQLYKRFLVSGHDVDLDKAISAFETCVRLIAAGSAEHTRQLSMLGTLLFQRMELSASLADFNRCIEVCEQALSSTLPDDEYKSPRLNTLGTSLLRRFENFYDLDDLHKSIDLLNESIQLTNADHPELPSRMSNLATALLRRFEWFSELTDIDEAVSEFEHVLRLTPDVDPTRPGRLNNLGNALLRRFERLNDAGDIDYAVMVSQEAVDLTTDDNPTKALYLNSLGNSLASRFPLSQAVDDIITSVSVLEAAIQITPEGHASRSSYLFNLGSALIVRFNFLHERDSIDRAIATFTDALKLRSDDHPDRPGLLNSLGEAYYQRFRSFDSIPDINESIVVREEAILLVLDTHPSKPIYLRGLSDSLYFRSQRLDAHWRSDVERAIEFSQQALDLTAEQDPQKPAILCTLGSCFLLRFEKSKDPDDVERAISIFEDAILLVPDKSTLLNNLGNCYFRRFEHCNDDDDLIRSIQCCQESADLAPDDHVDKPSTLNNLGASYCRHFLRFGDLDDLDRAVECLQHCVRLAVDAPDPKRPIHLTNLANSYMNRFERFHDIHDVDEAIHALQRAVTISPDDHPLKSLFLNNLGQSLLVRFLRLNEKGDVDSSVVFIERALLVAPKHPDRAVYLVNLGNSLLTRYERFEATDDMLKAILNLEEALTLTPYGHPNRSGRLSNLGNAFSRRFQRRRDPDDIQKSVSLLKDAVELLVDGHPDKPVCLSNLGTSLVDRFRFLHDLADIDEAIRIFEEAVGRTPADHPDKTGRLNNLGDTYLCRFEATQDSLALEQAIGKFSTAAQSSTGPPSIRFKSALKWIKSSQICRHSSLLEAYAFAIQILPQLAWLGLTMKDRHRELSEAGSIARDAAATAIDLGDPATAVEWLEQGRSIVWGQLLQLRTPVDDLEDVDPKLASDLRRVSRALEKASSRKDTAVHSLQAHASTMILELSLEEEAAQHRRLTLEWEKLVGAANKLLDGFLQPKKLPQLLTAAVFGPVVVLNASTIRCDALVLQTGRSDVIHVPLPRMTYKFACSLQKLTNNFAASSHRTVDEAATGRQETRGSGFVYSTAPGQQGNGAIQKVLSELWLRMVKPIMDSVSISIQTVKGIQTDPKRIFWCPTGPFTFLPVHAACFKNAASNSITWLDDFVISSYTPTLTALLRPSRQDAPKFSLLAVAQPSAKGQVFLPGTRKELEAIELHASVGLLPFSSLVESQATVDAVLQAMKDSSWVHFACHGVQDRRQPTDSGLLLAGGERLKLSEIIKLSRPQAGLAFLSACQTATGDENLSEEAVHLAAGMLLAGYDGVIGTMWTIGDRDAPQVANDVYAYLFRTAHPDSGQAAYALHHAVRQLRKSKAHFSWVPFIHVGL